MSRAKRILVVILCAGFSVFCSYAIRQRAPKVTLMCDFGEIYFGSRYALQHQDAYDPNTAAFVLSKELRLQDAKLPANPVRSAMARSFLTVQTYLPATLFVIAPLALLPWMVAQNLWMILTAGLLATGAWMIGELGTAEAADVWLLLAGFLLANCEGLLLDGNAAGIAVGLCLIATVCFLKNRCALLGAVLLAVSLVIKPHDSGFVWLYFLLTGGTLRKRALQALAVAAILAFCSSIWLAPISPHWPHELRRNLALLSAQGATDPTLSGTTNSGAGQIIDLQAALSILWNNPHFYNLVAWFVIGALILVWALASLRRRTSPQRALFALASISALSMLPVYHRSNDAKILLLAIPACAVLWTGKGARRWVALILTSASIFFTADMPLAVMGQLTRNLPNFSSNLPGKLLTVLLCRPTPLILLAMGCFYLWIYLRYSSSAESVAPNASATNTLTAKAAT